MTRCGNRRPQLVIIGVLPRVRSQRVKNGGSVLQSSLRDASLSTTPQAAGDWQQDLGLSQRPMRSSYEFCLAPRVTAGLLTTALSIPNHNPVSG